MRYWKLFVAALVAVCAVGASMAVTASATLPTFLPETVTKFTGKNTGSGQSNLLKANKEEVNCKEAIGLEGTIEANRHLGLFHIHFKGCTTLKGFATCTGLGEESGVILSLGSWHLVFDTLKATLAEAGVAILFLVDAVHFECAGVLVIVPLGGMVLCLVLNPTALTKLLEFHCNKAAGSSPPRPEETKYYNEAGTLVAIHRLESAVNEGTLEESTEEALGTFDFAGTETVLIMV